MADLCCKEMDGCVKHDYIKSFGKVRIEWVAEFYWENEDDSGNDELLIKYCPFCGERL